MHRPAQRRLTRARILVCAAAVPVILTASGCSLLPGSASNSHDDGGGDGPSASSPATTGSGGTASAQPAKYTTLPEPCHTLSKGTLDELVPKADPAGTAGKSEDTSLRGSCSWNSLDNNGVDGSDFRWLDVSLVRLESDPVRGSGNELAGQYAATQVSAAKATEGASKTRTDQVAGTGDEATSVQYELKKDEGTFKQQTVVARDENVVVTVDYNGAGLAGEKSPDAGELLHDAEQAAKETVAAVAAANAGGKSPSASGTGTTSSSSASSSSSSSNDPTSSHASSRMAFSSFSSFSSSASSSTWFSTAPFSPAPSPDSPRLPAGSSPRSASGGASGSVPSHSSSASERGL